MPRRPTDTILAMIPIKGQQELHLRLRELAGVPDMLDLAQYNIADQVHRQAATFPDDPRVIHAVIEALQRRLEQHAEPGAED